MQEFLQNSENIRKTTVVQHVKEDGCGAWSCILFDGANTVTQAS